MGKLTANQLKTLAKPGRYGDGGGLYFRVAPGGSTQWIQRIRIGGKRTDRGLGSFPLISLTEARKVADANRVAAATLKVEKALSASDAPTFKEFAVKVHAKKVKSGKLENAKHARNYLQVLERHVFPYIGATALDEITRRQVIAMMEDLAIKKGLVTTTIKVRGRVREILDHAVEADWIGENPAGDGIKVTMGDLTGGYKPKHFRAVRYEEVAGVLETIRQSNGMKSVRLALEFIIFTAARSGEARGASWGEIDLETATWTIPASRMKAGVEHRVPLSLQARMVLQEAKTLKGRTGNDLVFPHTSGRELSQTCLPLRCKKLGLKTTPHGFRSSFRGWAAEHEVGSWAAIEKCLSHKVGTAVEQAYFRVDMLAQRVNIMDGWANHVSPLPF